MHKRGALLVQLCLTICEIEHGPLDPDDVVPRNEAGGALNYTAGIDWQGGAVFTARRGLGGHSSNGLTELLLLPSTLEMLQWRRESQRRKGCGGR